MAELFAMLDEQWDQLSPYLVGPFTTQTFRILLEDKAPSAWARLVERYGPGGKGGGNFYSPSNILYNYLNHKARKSVVISRGFTPSLPGWGTSIVRQWELAGVIAPPPSEEDKTFIEGKQHLRTHLVRERAPGLRDHLIISRQGIGLSCDMCGASGEELDENIRTALFEAHHKTAPLAERGETKTTVEDMALLCACCHRLLHRLVSVHSRWFTVEEAKHKFGLVGVK